MIDVAILTTAVVSALTPYVVKGGEEIASSIASDLWKKVKDVFVSSGDEKLLDDLVERPEDQKNLAKVEYVLEKGLQNNPALIKDIASEVEKINASVLHHNDIQQNGNKNISVVGISGSAININTSK